MLQNRTVLYLLLTQCGWRQENDGLYPDMPDARTIAFLMKQGAGERSLPGHVRSRLAGRSDHRRFLRSTAAEEKERSNLNHRARIFTPGAPPSLSPAPRIRHDAGSQSRESTRMIQPPDPEPIPEPPPALPAPPRDVQEPAHEHNPRPGYAEDRHPKLRYEFYHEEKAKRASRSPCAAARRTSRRTRPPHSARSTAEERIHEVRHPACSGTTESRHETT